DSYSSVALMNYLQRLHESEQAMHGLETFVLDQARPMLLVQFGDHQPSFEGHEYYLPKRVPDVTGEKAVLVTYYSIRSNATHQPAQTVPLDIAFLGDEVLRRAGIEEDSYFRANGRLRELCAAHFRDCADKRVLDSYYAYVFGTLDEVAD